MRAQGLVPTVITHSALVRARAKGHKAERSGDQILMPNGITYSALAGAREKGPHCSAGPGALPKAAGPRPGA